jgi:hypothetical protein
VKAYLKNPKLSTSTKTEAYLGVDQSAQYLDGYCTEPSVLPIDIMPGSWYKCQFGLQDGWFFLKPFGRFGRAGIDLMIEDEIGTKIDGYFQLRRSI